MERLEDRRLMAITVTSLGDDLTGTEEGISLREAILQAADGETISFAVHGTIQLEDEIMVDKSLAIAGPGADLLTVRAFGGNPNLEFDGRRIFSVAFPGPSANVHIAGLRLSGGDEVSNGGAILNGGELTIEDCVITGNASSGTLGGGAIFNFNIGKLNLVSSVVSGNRTLGSGGAIFNLGGEVTVERSFLRGNTAATGGAISSSNGSVEVSYSTIAFNSAKVGFASSARGGGIELSGGSIVVFNSTISGNRADDGGGGVFLESVGAGSATFTHVTIAENRSDANGDGPGDGGGIFAAAGVVPELNHTIVAGNLKGTTFAQSSNVDGLWSGIFEIIAPDAGLGPLLYNGSAVPTHALLPGSPAIDAGDPNAAAGVAPIPFSDARGAGFTRVFDGNGVGGPRIDIGAFELQSGSVPLSLVVDILADENDGDYLAGDLSLREAIDLANRNHGVADTIAFAPSLGGGTIVLALGELAITDSLSIVGLGSKLLTIDASGNNLSAAAGDGSRIFTVDDGNLDHLSSVTIRGLRLVGGDPFSGGGAIRNSEDLTVSECEVSGNSAVADGGGILSTAGQLSVVDSIISGNSSHKDYATYGGGGGIATFSYLKLASSAVFGNVSSGHGGGIFAADGKLNVTNSTISGNSSGVDGTNPNQEGGGIFLGAGMDTAQGDVKIAHSTITRNSSPATGAGLYVDAQVAGAVVVDHSILAGNLGGDTNNNGLVFNFSLVGGDPLLALLGNNGGPTPTHAPLAGSAAIDGGDASFEAGVNGVPEFDQRGSSYSRVFGSSIDIGAFEFQPGNLAGDNNGDNFVDAADYTIWRNHEGQNVEVNTNGDQNGDGFVDGFDYAIWKSNFGNSLGSPGAGATFVALSSAKSAGSGAVLATQASAFEEGSVPLAGTVEIAGPLATVVESVPSLAAVTTTSPTVFWAPPLENRMREPDVVERRRRHGRAGGVAPEASDLLLAALDSESRQLDRLWRDDDAHCRPADHEAEVALVDSAIDALDFETGPTWIKTQRSRRF